MVVSISQAPYLVGMSLLLRQQLTEYYHIHDHLLVITPSSISLHFYLHSQFHKNRQNVIRRPALPAVQDVLCLHQENYM